MQLRIRLRDVEPSPEMRRGIERRLRFAFGRHVARIAVARVTLAAAPTANGEPGARCRIHTRFREGSTLVVEDRAGDLLAAADRAAWRLEHRLDRERGVRGRVA